MKKAIVTFQDMGIMGYRDAWEYQESLLQDNLAIKAAARNKALGAGLPVPPTKNHLLFVEHPAVYTIGKSGKMEHVLLSAEERAQKHIDFYQTNRGGDITYHGPGQLVGYPILDLENFYTDIGRYLRALEEVILLTLAHFGVVGGRSPGETGVWIDASVAGRERKVCAMGVRCSRWITMHGFALNVNTDLRYFDHIIPCGIRNKGVTSLSKELDRPVAMEAVKEAVKKSFAAVFNAEMVEENPASWIAGQHI